MRLLKAICLAVLILCLPCALADTEGKTVYISALTAEIFEAPDTLSTSYRILSYGESLTLHAWQDLWARVETADGRSGYCMLGALTNADPNTLDLSLPARTNVTATASPKIPSRKIADIPAGTEVHAIAQCAGNEYLRIEINGKCAYAPAEAFSIPVADHDQQRWINSNTRVSVHPEPDFWLDAIAFLSHGESFEVLSCLDTDWGNYAYIRMQNGTLGYINQTAVSRTDPNIFNIPMYARISGKILCEQALNPEDATASIGKGDEVSVVAITPGGHMLRLLYKGEYYYARSYFFSAEPDDASLQLQATTTMDVYMDDSLSPWQEDVLIPAPYWDVPAGEMTHPSNILRKLAAGEAVEVIGLTEKNNGLIVRCGDGATGYCHFHGLTSKTEPF